MGTFYIGILRDLKAKEPSYPDHQSVFDNRCTIPKHLKFLKIPPKEPIPFDWNEDHIHEYSQPMIHVQDQLFYEYKHRGRAYFIRIQRCANDSENGIVYWVDYRGHRLPMRQNTYMRNETSQRDERHGNNCFRITPYSSYTIWINGPIPALKLIRSLHLDFSTIELAPQVEGRLIFKEFKKRTIGAGRASICR